MLVLLRRLVLDTYKRMYQNRHKSRIYQSKLWSKKMSGI